MAEKKLTFNLITPQKPIVTNVEVESVVLPALLGELGILPGHIQEMNKIGKGERHHEFCSHIEWQISSRILLEHTLIN